MVSDRLNLANCNKIFLDLPWEDVLWKQLLPYLSIRDLFSLRLVNSHCKRLVDGYFSSLRQLDLSTISDQISSTAFNIITANIQYLTCLNLKNCTQCVSEEVLINLIEYNPRLTKVSFKNCNSLSDRVLLTLSASCLHLTHLNLSHCTWLHNVGLITIAFKCHSLKYVNINSCLNITDESIRILVFNCHKIFVDPVGNCWLNVLHDLRVMDLSNEMDAVRFQNQAIESRIVLLQMAGFFLKQHSASRINLSSILLLNTLKLNSIYNITDYSIEMISKACPELVFLDIRGCYQLTETCIRFIVTYCKSLKILKVKNCQHISDRCLLDLDKSIITDVLSEEKCNQKRILHITDQI